jgi:hypothetical protein
MGYILGVAVALAIILTAAFFLRRRAKSVPSEAALRPLMEQFLQLQSGLAEEFVRAAAATGKPRGLRWTRCDLAGEPLFAIDPERRELVALVGATIAFEAIEGGGMEDVEAVGNLRSATAVFVYRDGRWTTDGRVVFNLEPREAMERFGSSLVAVAAS